MAKLKESIVYGDLDIYGNSSVDGNIILRGNLILLNPPADPILVSEVTTDYTITDIEETITIFVSVSDVTLTLPVLANVVLGRKYVIKNISTGVIYIETQNSTLIDDFTSLTLLASESITILNDSSKWSIV
jgi:hypothetical protein